MAIFKKSIFRKSVYTVLPMFVFAVIGLSPVSSFASTISLPDASNSGVGVGRPDHVSPVNPTADKPEFYSRLVNTPAMIPASVPYNTLPGSISGETAVPVPAAVWLFGSGLLGLIGISRRKKTA